MSKSAWNSSYKSRPCSLGISFGCANSANEASVPDTSSVQRKAVFPSRVLCYTGSDLHRRHTPSMNVKVVCVPVVGDIVHLDGLLISLQKGSNVDYLLRSVHGQPGRLDGSKSTVEGCVHLTSCPRARIMRTCEPTLDIRCAQRLDLNVFSMS